MMRSRHPRQPQHNLPLALTSFVGREEEVAKVKRRLGTTRLLTLTGAGGVGKTRLALEVAVDVLELYPQGVWLIDLAPLDDPSVVPHVVASTLGVREAAGRPMIDALVDILRRRRLLLILDNCEHLITACASMVERLLRGCPDLQVLATGRQSLGVAGETAWRVPSLKLPWPAQLPADAPVTAYEAGRLFVERAEAALPGFDLTDANSSTIAHLCYQLDGIPLAIELAAARVKALSIDELAYRLHDRLRLLTGGSRTALLRHQTLRGTLDWSHELLSEAERILFRRLAVFAGGWTLRAAETVCPGDGIRPDDVLDLLAQLVDKSLVIAEPRRGDVRYRLLETTRQYGFERLGESGEAETLRRSHLSYFVELAERADPHVRGPGQLEWMPLLDDERDNIRAALQWSSEDSNGEAQLRLVAALWDYWWTRGYLSECQRWAEEAVSRGGVASHERGRALNAAGTIAGVRGEFERGEPWLTESVAVCRELGDIGGLARPLADLATTVFFRGDAQRGVELMNQSLQLAREALPGWDLAYIAYAAGFQEIIRGHPGVAAELLCEAADAYRSLGDRRGLAYSLLELASASGATGNGVGATSFGRESLDLFWQLGETYGLVGAFTLLASSAFEAARPDRAARLLGAADELCSTIGAALLPPWRADFDRTSEGARAAIGDAAFETAREEGRDLPLSEAVLYASSDEQLDGASMIGAPSAAAEKSLPLTPREIEVVALIARGRTNRQIGAELVITPGTATLHVKHILNKLGFASRAQIAAWAVQQNIFDTSAGVAG